MKNEGFNFLHFLPLFLMNDAVLNCGDMQIIH